MFKQNAVVLFQGDSITDGNWARNGDLNHFLGHGYAYLIAARLGAECPEKGWRFLNRGCSGNRIVDLHARWKGDAIQLAPDVISILIGVNDLWHAFAGGEGVTVPQYEKTYRTMLDETRAALPDVRLVLCDPFDLQAGAAKDRWQEWKADLEKRQDIVRRLAEEFEAVHVPFQQALDKAAERAAPEYWLWDGVHPTPAGHELLARSWLDSVAE